MSSRRSWGMTPRESIERECATRGRDAVIDGCITLLLSESPELDADFLAALAGPAVYRILSGESRADPELWIRVWALRGLLWAWDERASNALSDALSNRSWRVREMAIKVARRNAVIECRDAISQLVGDSSARVRATAVDALEQLTAVSA